MPRLKSARFRQLAQQLSAPEVPLVLLRIRHALLAEPMRFVNDEADLVSNGENYVAAKFNLIWPDDQDKQTPRAQLQIGNVRGDVGAFFERTRGAQGATVEVMQVLRSEPDFIEDSFILDVSNLVVSTMVATGQLGYDDVLNKPGTPMTYRPESAPGLF